MSSTEKINGIATAEDFRRLLRSAVEEALENSQVETVPLPSGLKVRLRNPGVTGAQMFVRLHRQRWKAFTDESAANEAKPENEREYAASVAYGDFLMDMFRRLFVQPRFGNLPGEIALGDILAPDLKFIFKWLGGEVVVRPGGSTDDLSTFPGRSGSVDGSGLDCAAEPLPAERVIGAAGNARLPD